MDPMSSVLAAVLAPDGGGGYATSVAGVALRLQRAGAGWSYTRDGLGGALPLAAEAPDRLRLVARTGAGEAVLRLDPPLLVLPDDAVELWVAWPLEVSVQLWGPGPARVEIDVFRPRFRRTVFGPVDTGRVLPAATSGPLDGPEAPREPGVAALRVRATNRAGAVVQLRRALVDERAIGLWAQGDRLAAGDVNLTVRTEGMAEAHSAPGVVPAGWAEISAPDRAPGAALAWLLDATRRSVEYPQ